MTMGYTLVAKRSTEPKIRRQAVKEFNTVVGMDVHKNSIQIVTAEAEGAMEVRHYGKIGGTMDALDRAARKLVSGGSTLRFVYEAGPCGYEIYRHLTGRDFPARWSLLPKLHGKAETGSRTTEGMQRVSRAWSARAS